MAEPLRREIITTEDGSSTLVIPQMNEQYHSIHGAIQESNHVYIDAGLSNFFTKKEINLFEVGFGTGLNALLTCIVAKQQKIRVNYTSIEKYPLTKEESDLLNYGYLTDNISCFRLMHSSEWDKHIRVSEDFILTKVKTDLTIFDTDKKFDLIYFDAFAPDIQPQLWAPDIFIKMYQLLNPEGILVTYSAKGQVRRNMQTAGFKVERLSGPPGKREMLRAVR